MNMMVIDAKDLILGRMATFVATKLLSGEEVTIINAEKAVVSGGEKDVLVRYKHAVARGNMIKGPFFPRTPDGIVKHAVRGMIPVKKEMGRQAFKRLRVVCGEPEGAGKHAKAETIKGIDKSILRDQKYVSVGDISAAVGCKNLSR